MHEILVGLVVFHYWFTGPPKTRDHLRPKYERKPPPCLQHVFSHSWKKSSAEVALTLCRCMLVGGYSTSSSFKTFVSVFSCLARRFPNLQIPAWGMNLIGKPTSASPIESDESGVRVGRNKISMTRTGNHKRVLLFSLILTVWMEFDFSLIWLIPFKGRRTM